MSASAATILAFALAGCEAAKTGPVASATPKQEAPPQVQPPASFVVRFKAPHPLAQAQELEAAGRCEEAQRLARQTLTARPELAGLCFNRFTVGGAEIVLEACAPPSDVSAFQRAWTQRFAGMEEVEYAEPNVTASAAARCP